MRIVHSSDLHLGKRFGTLPEDLRGRLVEARHGAIGRLASVARSAGAAHVLLAGDTFDTETPADAVRVQALRAMGDDLGLTWWLLPGNHDSLAAEALWERVRRDAPGNVRCLAVPGPVEMAFGVQILAAPLPHRFPGRDLTQAWAHMSTPEGAARLGLAHGGVQAFHEEADTSAVIAPDRAEVAGLDYLALGDWHGQLQIGPRTWYSGSPERDRFKHNGRGACLVVNLDGEPQVQSVETGLFDWTETTLTLVPGADVDLKRVVPGTGRRDCLIRIVADGALRLSERAALEAAVTALAPEFGRLEMVTERLSTDVAAGDLDAIGTGGALRAAAEALRTGAEDTTCSAEDREISARALDRLWTLAQAAEE